MVKVSPSSAFSAYSEGLPLGVGKSGPAPPVTESVSAEPRGSSSGPRSPESGGHLRGRHTAMLPLSHLCGSKGTNWLPFDSGCLGSQQVSRSSLVQDVESCDPEPCHGLSSLDGKSRPQGCLSSRPDQEQLTQVPGPDVLGKALLLSSSPIRSGNGPLAVLVPNGGSPSKAQSQRVQYLGLPGRLGNLEHFEGDSPRPSSGNDPAPVGVRADSEPKEITSFSSIISSLGRGSLGLSNGHLVSTAEASRRDRVVSEPPSRISQRFEKTVGTTVRPSGLRSSGKQKSPPSDASNIPARALRPRPRQRQLGSVPSQTPKGSGALDKGKVLVDPRPLRSSAQLHPDLDRCVLNRVGRPRRTRPVLARTLDKGAKRLAHQCLRASDHTTSARSAPASRLIGSSVVRQSDSDKGHPETRLSFPRSSKARRRSSSDLRGEKDHAQAKAYSGQTECGSRRSLTRGSNTRRVGVKRGGICSSPGAARVPPPGGPVCLPAQRQTQGILLPIQSPQGLGAGRSCARLEQVPTGLDLSSSGPDKGSSKEASVLQGRGSLSSSEQACPIARNPSLVAHEGTSHGSSSPEANGEIGPSIRGVLSLSRLEFLRAIYLKSYKEEVVNQLLNHLASSSLRQYESAWKRFQNWLPAETKKVDVPLVASFLVYCSQNLSPRTVLTVRAALALPLKEAFGVDFEHNHFKMLAKGAFRMKPPVPKIVPSWSLDQALQRLQKMRIASSDKPARFKKALFLLAIASSNRVCELAAIDRKNIVFRQHSVILPVKAGFVFKNQAQYHAPSIIEIPDLPGSDLCPVKALRDYVSDLGDSSEESLFLHPRSGKPLNAGRVAFFLAKAVSWLLPNSLAKGHDSRKLSTSNAFMLGVPASQIVAAGSWRSSNTFAKRYLVPLVPSGSRAVLARTRC